MKSELSKEQLLVLCCWMNNEQPILEKNKDDEIIEPLVSICRVTIRQCSCSN
jgi:hypothetical protein